MRTTLNVDDDVLLVVQEMARREGRPTGKVCDISLLDPRIVDRSRLYSARQITDAYLLALAVKHGGRFATFDRAVSLS